MKKIISIETVMDHQDWRQRFNAISLEDITFIYGGKPINVPYKMIDQWRFTGMNNVDFVRMKLLELVGEDTS